MILDNPRCLIRAYLLSGAVLLAPLTALAGDPAPASKPVKSTAAPAQSPVTPAPSGAASPEAAAATPTADPVAAAPAAPANTAPTEALASATVPAQTPAGWEGESAKDRLSASMYPHETETIAINLRGQDGDTFYAWLGGGRTTKHATLQIDGEVFEQLCDAPCTAQLPAGRNRIAVARGGSPVPASQDITLYAPTTLTASYSSYAVQRILGALVLVGGSVGGLALVLTAPDCKENPSNPNEPYKCNNTQEYIGIGVGVVSVVTGSLLLLKSDEVEVAVAPGPGVSPAASRGRNGGDQLADSLKGLQLSLRF